MPTPKSLPGLPDDYTSKFFMGDVVTKFADGQYRARVLRCWADEEGAINPDEATHPLDRPLLRGEVGVSNMRTGELLFLPESGLILFQREFLKGDVVKRSLTNVESATVLDIRTEVQLEHLVTKERIKEWIPFEKVRNSLLIEARDRVVYDEWIGTVEEIFEDALIESKDGSCYRIAEMGGFLDTGRLLSEVIAKDHLDQNIHPRLPPNADPATDRIVDIRPVVLYITWNAINQQLPISEQHKYPEPKKFWYGSDMSKLTHFNSTHSQPAALGATVVFIDQADEKVYGVKSTKHASGDVTLRSLKVVETRTQVKLRWQDGTETTDWTTELVPYRNIDDFESWPGEHLVWRGDNGERRPAVVLNFNPHQRIADLLFMDNQEKGTVSVMELDPGGQGRANYGVAVGEQVLICDDNGSPLPEVPTLGQFDTPVDNMWWRNELAKLAERYGEDPIGFGVKFPAGDPKAITWWGEVHHLHLDGAVDVKLASGEIRRLSIKNLQMLNEPGDMLGDEMMGPAEMMDDFMDVLHEDPIGSEASWETLPIPGLPEVMSHDVWPETSGEYETYDEEEGMEVDEDEQERRDVELVDPMLSASAPATPIISSSLLPEAEAGPSQPQSNGTSAKSKPLEDSQDWPSFEMLEEAPMDHHFIGETAGSGSRAYSTRLAKEHRALMSSLPENILVRTYENRTDLMRCLIIGPEGTPYADAPFVFDIYLNPSKFPHEPPTVHFHSHTQGKGRCNPNLYEDGKVCLSILGTWSGDQSESWNPQKSSLLQVFVSISGLVLVRSPYHCEPAFAKLEGTREGKVNSRLYSEKAYVLSRSFVRTALERPPSGLEKELKHLYLQKGRLKAVIDHARTLMNKGQAEGSSSSNGNGDGQLQEENEEMWNADAMGSLTMGAILSLRRTIEALESLWAEASQSG